MSLCILGMPRSTRTSIMNVESLDQHRFTLKFLMAPREGAPLSKVIEDSFERLASSCSQLICLDSAGTHIEIREP